MITGADYKHQRKLNSEIKKNKIDKSDLDRRNRVEFTTAKLKPHIESKGEKLIYCNVPLMFLRYLYLFIDPAPVDQFETINRHPLCCCELKHEEEIPKVPAVKFAADNLIQKYYDKYGVSTGFYHLKLFLDTNGLPFGDCKNVTLIETPLEMTISCTTTIYSFEEKILETREVKDYHRLQGSSYIYTFDFVRQYWTAFFNGYHYLQSEVEAEKALDSLTMFQVFHAVDEVLEETPLLCISYEFAQGGGNVEMSEIVD